MCFHCTDSIENEYHVALVCPLYTGLRTDLLDAARGIDGDFDQMNASEQLAFILSSDTLVRPCTRTLNDILKCRRSLFYA